VKRTTVNQRVTGLSDYLHSWRDAPFTRRVERMFQGFDNIEKHPITFSGRGDIHGQWPSCNGCKTFDHKSQIAVVDIDDCLCIELPRPTDCQHFG
jgi:hypothetical protein